MQNGAMSPTTRHNWILRLGTALFLAGQALSIAHASEFGSDPHEHNGVACLAILTDEQDGIVASAHPAASASVASASATPQPKRQAPRERAHSILPPPTGPPPFQGVFTSLRR